MDTLSIIATLWWLSFWTALGLCIGSFLNVIIYRLPRNKSLSDPVWSACPSCRHRIHWFDNIPVLSFILLRGRCRMCGVPISTRYLVFEALMALVVLMLLDAFFVGQVRWGFSESPFGLTDRLAADWPIFVAHIILFACLLSMSAIDLEHYWVDIRFTNFATLAGFAGHILWTPRHSTSWIRPYDSTALACVMAVLGLGVAWIVFTCWPIDHDEEDEPVDEEDATATVSEAPTRRKPPPSLASPSRMAGWLALTLLVMAFTFMAIDEIEVVAMRHVGRGLFPLCFLFGLVVWESTIVRRSDQRIVDAIHEERHSARRMVLREAVYLLPAVLGAIVGVWIMHSDSGASTAVSEALHSGTRVGNLSLMRHWSPLMGLATAASGYVIAGAIGWTVRIFFTLLFGREAFGVGDIHLMAAAGCVAGWPVVALGGFLACGLALLGWVLSLPFKRTRALPMGPWLSLSFLAVVIYQDTIIKWPIIERTIAATSVLISYNSQ